MSIWYHTGDGKHIVVDNQVVEYDALRIAEAIRDYDPNLVLLCLNPERAEGITDEPFIVAERGKDNILRPVLRAWILDDKILERLYNSDTQRHDVFNALETLERQQKEKSNQRYKEKREETKDVIAGIAGMKSRYSVKDSNTGDLLTFFDDRPASRSSRNKITGEK